MIEIETIRKKLKNCTPQSVPETYRHPYSAEDIARAIPAAVLVALQLRNDIWHVLLTKRSTTLEDHPGQISFAGGRQDSSDTDSRETALREAEEEIGLPRHQVEILATLNPHFIARKYLVTPHVGLVGTFTPKIDPIEVEELFSAPLDFFLDDQNCTPDQRYPDYDGYQFDYKGMNIWGGTASILLNLKNILKNAT